MRSSDSHRLPSCRSPHPAAFPEAKVQNQIESQNETSRTTQLKPSSKTDPIATIGCRYSSTKYSIQHSVISGCFRPPIRSSVSVRFALLLVAYPAVFSNVLSAF